MGGAYEALPAPIDNLSYSALLAGLAIYARHLHAATPCSEKAVEAARAMTAEDQTRIMAADLAKRAKAGQGAMTLDGIEARGRSVIVRFRIAEYPEGPAAAAAFVDRFRRATSPNSATPRAAPTPTCASSA